MLRNIYFSSPPLAYVCGQRLEPGMSLVSGLARPEQGACEACVWLRQRLWLRERIDSEQREDGHGENEFVLIQDVLDLFPSESHVLLHGDKVGQIFAVGTA